MKQTLLLLCLTIGLTPEHVKRVIDGDTFVLFAFDTPPEERVRVLGVDTPERNEPGFSAASAFTADWLRRGPFSLTTCDRDSFGRRLATVSRHDSSLAQSLKDAGLGK
jgi:micrococcal nuclease